MSSRISHAAFYAQAHLDQPLSLSLLAGIAGLSSAQFHRVFSREMGETPARYVRRLRVEKAAFCLRLHADPVLAIALECGFCSPETLTRAFHRHFGLTPRAYRRDARSLVPSTLQRAPCEGAPYELGAVRLVQMRPVPIAMIRVVGPYEQVDPALWPRLVSWARDQGYSDPPMLIGIGHDAPNLTSPDKLRFDVAISVPEGAVGTGDIRIARLPERLYAHTTHTGPYDSLPRAYPALFATIAGLCAIRVEAAPVIEIYRDAEVNVARGLSVTDIYIPVIKVTL